MSTPQGLPRSRARLWVLVLLAALLLPGAHTGTAISPSPPVAGEAVEYDLVESALRPPARGAHRHVVPPRPAARPGPAPVVPRARPLPAPSSPPYTVRALRTVVLRC